VIQEAEAKTRTEISAAFSNIMAISDLLTQSNVKTKKEGQQELAKDKPIIQNKLTKIEKDVKSGAAQFPANREQTEKQTQTVFTTDVQRVSAEESFETNEQSMFLKDVSTAGDESDAIQKDDFISEQKTDMVQEAKIGDKVAKDSENTDSILDETRLLTSAEKSDSSIRMINSYPAVLFQNHIDERITTTSLLPYLEGSGHATLDSHEVERSIEETRTSSVVKEDPGHSVVGEEPSGKEASASLKIDEPPRLLSKGKVNYPFRAKRRGLTGKVSVSFLVDTDGQATNIEAVKAEPENVLMTFAGAAEKAIAKSRFKPGTSAGEPVPVKVVSSIRFEFL
jgi:TonB family protein